MKNIKSLLSLVDENRDKMQLGLISNPGCSKTEQVKQWAEENHRHVCELVLSQRLPTEISGMPMPVQETKSMEIFDYDTLLSLNDGDVLFLDEFTNGNVQTLNACLTVVQDRKTISGKSLPSLLVVAAGNPQGSQMLLPQIKQRFLWYQVGFCSAFWIRYIQEKFCLPSEVKPALRRVADRIIDEKFSSTEYNYLTPRTCEQLIQLAISAGSPNDFEVLTQFVESSIAALICEIVRSQNDNFKDSMDQRNYLREVIQERTGLPVSDNVTDDVLLGLLKELFPPEEIAQLAEDINAGKYIKH